MNSRIEVLYECQTPTISPTDSGAMVQYEVGRLIVNDHVLDAVLRSDRHSDVPIVRGRYPHRSWIPLSLVEQALAAYGTEHSFPAKVLLQPVFSRKEVLPSYSNDAEPGYLVAALRAEEVFCKASERPGPKGSKPSLLLPDGIANMRSRCSNWEAPPIETIQSPRLVLRGYPALLAWFMQPLIAATP